MNKKQFPKDSKKSGINEVLEAERKKLEESSRLLAAIVESSADAIIGKDLDGNITSWNKAAQKMYAYSHEEILGKSISILVPANLAEDITQIMAAIKNGESIKQYDTIRRKKNGEIINVSLSISPVLDSDGSIVGASTIAQDITERKQIEEKLKESEEKFREVFNQAKDAIFLLKFEDEKLGKFVEVNDFACQILGYSREELMQMGPEDMMAMLTGDSPTTMANIPQIVKKLLKDGKITFEADSITKDGKKLPFEITSHVFSLKGEEYFLSIGRDIRERKKAEKVLSRELEINSEITKISSKLLESTPIEDISDLVLKYAQKITQSKFGFVGYIDPKTSYLIAPTMTRNIWTECHVKDKSVIFEKFGGMWGWVLNNKKSILTNHPKDDPRSTGTPSGHIDIETFLAVPALFNDNLVGIISLANSDNYDEKDLEVVERLSNLYAIAINRKHSEETIRKSEEKYRNIVEKFLKVSNEILIEINKKE
jgi:PAS domain S-box-containing protein